MAYSPIKFGYVHMEANSVKIIIGNVRLAVLQLYLEAEKLKDRLIFFSRCGNFEISSQLFRKNAKQIFYGITPFFTPLRIVAQRCRQLAT